VQAQHALGLTEHTEAAFIDLKNAHSIDKADKAVAELLHVLSMELKQQRKKEKQAYQNIFSAVRPLFANASFAKSGAQSFGWDLHALEERIWDCSCCSFVCQIAQKSCSRSLFFLPPDVQCCPMLAAS
jgi:hypothetical protein